MAHAKLQDFSCEIQMCVQSSAAVIAAASCWREHVYCVHLSRANKGFTHAHRPCVLRLFFKWANCRRSSLCGDAAHATRVQGCEESVCEREQCLTQFTVLQINIVAEELMRGRDTHTQCLAALLLVQFVLFQYVLLCRYGVRSAPPFPTHSTHKRSTFMLCECGRARLMLVNGNGLHGTDRRTGGRVRASAPDLSAGSGNFLEWHSVWHYQL